MIFMNAPLYCKGFIYEFIRIQVTSRQDQKAWITTVARLTRTHRYSDPTVNEMRTKEEDSAVEWKPQGLPSLNADLPPSVKALSVPTEEVSVKASEHVCLPDQSVP